MKKWWFILLIIQYSCNSNTIEEFQLEEGDILFQDLDSSPLCDAIELVTPGYKNANISHIGIIVRLEDTVKVIEAIPDKVQITKLDKFLTRSFDINNNPKVIVGRLKPEYQHTIIDAISFLKSKLNMHYDDHFVMNNNSYYCSELIYEAFEKDTVFKLFPMTFLHPITNDTLSIWRDYYSKLGSRIPQNQLGINPGIISLSGKIEIIHLYGYPDGIEK
ncbi:MAG: YiiX/YebB-like N1pC/P60 family cysteine hydrolase [Bacteroidota bacterium]|nr:YiiX/YebB-like N1pC/P60 family cysteine hydrolase [Bacteroidota bacterium]